GDDAADRHVAQVPGGRLELLTAALAEADEQRRRHVGHDDVRNAHALDGAAVDGLDREPAALGGQAQPDAGRPGGAAAEHAVRQHDLPEVAGALGAELEAVGHAAQAAVRDQHVLSGPRLAADEARLEAERVVVGLDVAVHDAHPTAAVEVDAVGIGVADDDAVDHHVVAVAEADGVVRRPQDGETAHRDEPAALQRDRLRTEPPAAVHV